jgi:sulfate/thiosulfate transport system ATP-binding protein
MPTAHSTTTRTDAAHGGDDLPSPPVGGRARQAAEVAVAGRGPRPDLEDRGVNERPGATVVPPAPPSPAHTPGAAAARRDGVRKAGVGLRIERVSKRYAGTAALDGVDLDIGAGELVALLGPSGSGKTTLLRAIAGLLPIDAGRIVFGDTDATALSLRERNVGFVFQQYALFRHMTVAENIAFGLRSRPRRQRPDRSAIRLRVEELLALIQLPDVAARYPEQLSGGQKQRVALARALAIDPTVLLLDEPFGALDAKVRVDLRRWLRHLHDRTGQTTVFVTHDQEEALELADRVVVLREGRIEQVGTPDEVYDQPASAYVFDFVGRADAIDGEVRDGVFLATGQSRPLPAPDAADGAGTLHVRPHDVAVVADGDGLGASVVAVRRLAERITLELRLPSQPRVFEIDLLAAPGVTTPAVGQAVAVRPMRYRIYPRAAQPG